MRGYGKWVKIVTVIGARPQFIKAAAVSRAIATHNTSCPDRAIQECLVHTGQHYDHGMSQRFFDELEIPAPAVNLGIAGGNHGHMTGAMLAGIEQVLLKEKPALTLIYGDTNSTLAAALAAAKLHVPLAHVEAGLRSFNKLMPEEVNRICADHVSSLLFCPSEVAVRNLAEEGITKGVEMTGDVMADALGAAMKRAHETPGVLDGLIADRNSGSLALLTIHRAENTASAETLAQIFTTFAAWHGRFVFPVHPRTRKLLTDAGLKLPANIHAIEPVGYLEMAALLDACDLVITDSGGLQKEAYWAGLPCITLRPETEWTETVDSGWNTLVGTDASRIKQALELSAATPAERPALYGDGRAADRIVASLCRHLYEGK
jgi:UDP-GlcNAc3NAcA epimerase